MKYQSFEDMVVWQKAMELAQKTFELTASLPRKEDYGLTSQLRRSALSISGNIAEGFGRKHIKDKLKYYYVSRGSLSETKSHFIYAQKVNYLSEVDMNELKILIADIWIELNRLISSLEKKQ